MSKKENARQPKSTSAKTKPKFTDNSAEGQRARLLEALKCGPLTTIEIRHDLDIMMPAARVHELRHIEDQNIDMHWVSRPTAAGNLHRVGMYVLMPPSPVFLPTKSLDLFPAMEAA